MSSWIKLLGKEWVNAAGGREGRKGSEGCCVRKDTISLASPSSSAAVHSNSPHFPFFSYNQGWSKRRKGTSRRKGQWGKEENGRSIKNDREGRRQIEERKEES